MSKHRVLMICVLMAVTAILVPRPASAADSYEIVVEYNGPNFYVVNAPGVKQLVDDPMTITPFLNPYGVGVSIAADGRIMNYVLDSGNKRIMGFETNMDLTHYDQTLCVWTEPVVGADDWDNDQIYLSEWVAVSTKWIIPYSEIVKVDGETWKWVADLTGFSASDKVYTIDYDDATNAPEILFPANSLSATSTFELVYAITDYQGGGTAAFGLGDIDMDCANGATIEQVLIDEAAPSVVSLQDLRSLFTIPLEGTATTDEVWIVDAMDNSPSANQFVQVYTITDAGAEAFLEAYDDVLNQPSDVYVAGTGAGYTVSTWPASTQLFWTAQAVSDANQISGHNYYIEVSAGNLFTITDLTTGRVLVKDGAAADFVGALNAVFPGAAVTWDNTWAAGAASETVFSTRAAHDRYAFICDRGNDRIKVVSSAHTAAAIGDDLPGDAHTCVVQPTGAGTIGLTADEDYYFTTPATVPENWQTGTPARPVKENTITVIEDPAGTPVTWTMVVDLALAGPSDKVYTIDWWEGTITFGDGLHGEMPSAATAFSATYTTTPDVLRYGSRGSSEGQFSDPSGICARWSSSLGVFVVYIADTGNSRIQKFHFHPEDLNLGHPPWMEFICEWNTATTSTDYLMGPTCVDIDTDGTDYFIAVADYQNCRVVIYDDTKFNVPEVSHTLPTYETAIGSAGNSIGSFFDISAVDLVKNGTELEIYVADGDRNTITKHVKAPSPSIVLSFTVSTASELPMSFPPTSSYTFTYAVTNSPVSGWVDFYYDTAGSFSDVTARLCFPAGTIGTADSPLVWNFSASPDGTPEDGTYYVYAILRDAQGNPVAQDQALSTELLTIDSELLPALQVRDFFDGDPTELIAPNEPQTISLELSYPDSVQGCAFIGTYPTDILDITGIVEANPWLDIGATGVTYYHTYDEDAGTFAVFSAATGAPNGLSGNGSFKVATIHVQAKDALTDDNRTMNGIFDLDETQSSIENIHGNELESWSAKDMTVRLAFVGDVATSGIPATVDSQVPYQQPKPDGYMNFADQMALSLGWNGAVVNGQFLRDPIADMGPIVSGTEPKLVPKRDGNYDVDDLLAFTRNWSWFGANGYVTPSMSGGRPGTAFMPLGEPVEDQASVSLTTIMAEPLPGQTVSVDIRVDGAAMLTGAMVRVAYEPAELTLVSVEKGEMLARNGGNIMLNTIRRDGVCEVCMTRLCPERPGVDGSGVIASLVFRITSPPESGMNYVYDLRDSRNKVLARGSSEIQSFGQGRLEKVVLCQNYPNPLDPVTSIVFTLPTKQAVDLAVFDLTGRRVATLVNGPQDAGIHNIEWDGRDQSGAQVASGVYFYKLRAGDVVQSRKLLITR